MLRHQAAVYILCMLRLRPGGPRALRTPGQLDGIEGLSANEATQLQESSILFDRCAECACITHTAGGHAHIEQPSGAMSWREPMAQSWMLQSSCNLVLVAACSYAMDIYKNWLFATSFQELSAIASRCNHASNTHQSIAGVRASDGSFKSKQSAEYPAELATAMAKILAPLISTGPELSSIPAAMNQVRTKHLKDPPLLRWKMGGGLMFYSRLELSTQHKLNLFKAVRDSFCPLLFHHGMPKRVLAHFAQRLEHCPIPDDLVLQLRNILCQHIPGLSADSWSIRDDQPLYLDALQSFY